MTEPISLPPLVQGEQQSTLRISVSKVVWKRSVTLAQVISKSKSKQPLNLPKWLKSSKPPLVKLCWWGSSEASVYHPMNINLKEEFNNTTQSSPTTTIEYPINCSKNAFSTYLKDQQNLIFELMIGNILLGKSLLSLPVLQQAVAGRPVNQFFNIKDCKGSDIAQIHIVLTIADFEEESRVLTFNLYNQQNLDSENTVSYPEKSVREPKRNESESDDECDSPSAFKNENHELIPEKAKNTMFKETNEHKVDLEQVERNIAHETREIVHAMIGTNVKPQADVPASSLDDDDDVIDYILAKAEILGASMDRCLKEGIESVTVGEAEEQLTEEDIEDLVIEVLNEGICTKSDFDGVSLLDFSISEEQSITDARQMEKSNGKSTSKTLQKQGKSIEELDTAQKTADGQSLYEKYSNICKVQLKVLSLELAIPSVGDREYSVNVEIPQRFPCQKPGLEYSNQFPPPFGNRPPAHTAKDKNFPSSSAIVNASKSLPLLSKSRTTLQNRGSKAAVKQQHVIPIESEFEFDLRFVNTSDIEAFEEMQVQFLVSSELTKKSRAVSKGIGLVNATGILTGKEITESDNFRQMHVVSLWKHVLVPGKPKKTSYFGIIKVQVALVDKRFIPGFVSPSPPKKQLNPLYFTLKFTELRSIILPPEASETADCMHTIHLSLRLLKGLLIESPPCVCQINSNLDLVSELNYVYSTAISLNTGLVETLSKYPLYVEVWCTRISQEQTDTSVFLLGMLKVPSQSIFSSLRDELNDGEFELIQPIQLPQSDYPVVDLVSGMNKAWMSTFCCVGTWDQVQSLQHLNQDNLDSLDNQDNLDAKDTIIKETMNDKPLDRTHAATLATVDQRPASPTRSVGSPVRLYPQNNIQETPAVTTEAEIDGSSLERLENAANNQKSATATGEPIIPNDEKDQNLLTEKLPLLLNSEIAERIANDLSSEPSFEATDIHIQVIIHRSAGLLSLLDQEFRRAALDKGIDTFVKFSPFNSTIENDSNQLVESKVILNSMCPVYNHAVLLTIDGRDSSFMDWIRVNGEANGAIYGRIHDDELGESEFKMIGQFKLQVNELLERPLGIHRKWCRIDSVLTNKSASIQLSMNVQNGIEQGFVPEIDWSLLSDDRYMLHTELEIVSATVDVDTLLGDPQSVWVEFKFPSWHSDCECILLETFKSESCLYSSEMHFNWQENIVCDFQGETLCQLAKDGLRLNVLASSSEGVEKIGFCVLDMWDSVYKLVQSWRLQKRRKYSLKDFSCQYQLPLVDPLSQLTKNLNLNVTVSMRLVKVNRKLIEDSALNNLTENGETDLDQQHFDESFLQNSVLRSFHSVSTVEDELLGTSSDHDHACIVSQVSPNIESVGTLCILVDRVTLWDFSLLQRAAVSCLVTLSMEQSLVSTNHKTKSIPFEQPLKWDESLHISVDKSKIQNDSSVLQHLELNLIASTKSSDQFIMGTARVDLSILFTAAFEEIDGWYGIYNEYSQGIGEILVKVKPDFELKGSLPEPESSTRLSSAFEYTDDDPFRKTLQELDDLKDFIDNGMIYQQADASLSLDSLIGCHKDATTPSFNSPQESVKYENIDDFVLKFVSSSIQKSVQELLGDDMCDDVSLEIQGSGPFHPDATASHADVFNLAVFDGLSSCEEAQIESVEVCVQPANFMVVEAAQDVELVECLKAIEAIEEIAPTDESTAKRPQDEQVILTVSSSTEKHDGNQLGLGKSILPSFVLDEQNLTEQVLDAICFTNQASSPISNIQVDSETQTAQENLEFEASIESITHGALLEIQELKGSDLNESVADVCVYDSALEKHASAQDSKVIDSTHKNYKPSDRSHRDIPAFINRNTRLGDTNTQFVGQNQHSLTSSLASTGPTHTTDHGMTFRVTNTTPMIRSKPPLLPSSGFLDWYKKWKDIKHTRSDQITSTTTSVPKTSDSMFRSTRMDQFSSKTNQEKERIHKIFSSSNFL